MNRTLALGIIAVWLSALAMLLHRDVLPYWRAQDPPRGRIADADEQVAILDARGRRMGTSWMTIRHIDRSCTWQSFTTLADLSLPGIATIPSVAVDTTLEFQPDGALGSFETRILGMGTILSMTGHLLGIDYSCLATIGALRHPFSLDARLSRQIGESLRPFTQLPNLHVGQSWQVRILDPVGLIMGQTPEFRRILVTVTGLHTIEHRGEQVECFQVESDGAYAWVDHAGRVRVQTVMVPLIGKITLSDEPFDGAARIAARRTYTSGAAAAAPKPGN